MTSNERIQVAWDTCSFIDYISSKRSEIDALLEIVRIAKLTAIESKNKLPSIFVSTMVIVEMFKGDDHLKVREHLKNPYFRVVSLERKIAELAQDLRVKHEVAARDSVHLATALIGNIPVFLTRDGSGGDGQCQRHDGKKLIPLNGKLSINVDGKLVEGGQALRIMTPHAWLAEREGAGLPYHLSPASSVPAQTTAPVPPSTQSAPAASSTN